MEMEITNTIQMTMNASPRRTCHLNSDSLFNCGKVTAEELKVVTTELKNISAKSQRIQWAMKFVTKDGELKCVFPYTEKRICLAFMAEVLECSTRSIRNYKNQEIKTENQESN
jgi:hypothetical protein